MYILREIGYHFYYVALPVLNAPMLSVLHTSACYAPVLLAIKSVNTG